MEYNMKSELMYRFSDYIGTFATLDATIKSANETIKTDVKGYCYSEV